MKIDQKKKKLRILSSKKRAILYRDNQYSSSKLVKKILEIENLDKIKIIASFISIKTEISTKPLNDFLISIGKKICLPVILNNNNYLIFRSFNKKIILIKGKYNIPIPDETREEMLPDLILTPCLAFDKYGYRLGYGGGYYDRTFIQLKKIDHPFISVGLAYDDQKINKVSKDYNDQKIDYILTEKRLYTIK